MKIDGRTKIIKPGQKFWALPEEVPVEFRDVLKPLHKEELKEAVSEVPVEKAVVTYELSHRGGGRYIVEDADGKRVNEEYLSKEEAQALIESLTVK